MTVETNSDTCNYKTVWRDRERMKETKETVETVETSGGRYMQIQNCMKRQRDQRRLKRLWRPMEIQFKYKKYVETERDCVRLRRLWKPLEIHASIKLYGESGRD